jgi:hypothetical protein
MRLIKTTATTTEIPCVTADDAPKTLKSGRSMAVNAGSATTPKRTLVVVMPSWHPVR